MIKKGQVATASQLIHYTITKPATDYPCAYKTEPPASPYIRRVFSKLPSDRVIQAPVLNTSITSSLLQHKSPSYLL